MKRLLYVLILIVPMMGFAQRVINVAPRAIFAFDPLSDRYVKQSLAPVATYVSAWIEQGSALTIQVCDTALLPSYQLYLNVVDSTLLTRVLTYLSAQKSDTLTFSDEAFYEFPQSRDFLAHFEADIQRIKRFFSTPLRVTDSAQRFDPYAPCEFSNLFHTFQLAVSGADVSIFAPSTLDAVVAKELYVKNIFSLFPFNNQLVTIKLSGQEIKNLLEKIYSDRYFLLKNDRSDLLRHRLPAYLHASLAGTAFQVNLTNPRGGRIENFSLFPSAIYTVVMNSFAAREYKQLVQLGDYKTLLVKYLLFKNSTVNKEIWSLKPERWVHEIKLRETPLIFGK